MIIMSLFHFKKNNVTAVQFHPELSGKSGTTFLTQYFNDGDS